MKKQKIQCYLDKAKSAIYSLIIRKANKVQTPMTNLMLQLELKGLLPKKIKAIELFGMHGLWHTLDYVKKVESLDIFEIDEVYHNYSKKVLKDYNVNYYNSDCLQYAQTTKEKYNLIVADIPYSGNFYNDSGLPFFFNSLVRMSDTKSVIVFNIHSSRLNSFKKVVDEIENNLSTHHINDLFFVPRNNQISYVVLAINDKKVS